MKWGAPCDLLISQHAFGDRRVVAPKSAFSAKLSEARTTPLGVGDAVRFDKIVLNEQGDYNAETGRFTCRVPGVYYFAVHATVYRSSLQFDLMKNGHTVASYFQIFGNWVCVQKSLLA